jgi:hypothetical protein
MDGQNAILGQRSKVMNAIATNSTGLWVDKGIAEVIGIALKIGKVSDDYATGDSQMTPNIFPELH